MELRPTERSYKGNRGLGAGDVLLVTRLDRLARSTRDLLNVLATISDKGAGFKSLADTWADTTTAHGRLMLTVLGGLAEFERELIRARTDEGRKRAQARGVRFGRKLKLSSIKSLRLYSVGKRERHWLRLGDPTTSAIRQFLGCRAQRRLSSMSPKKLRNIV